MKKLSLLSCSIIACHLVPISMASQAMAYDDANDDKGEVKKLAAYQPTSPNFNRQQINEPASEGTFVGSIAINSNGIDTQEFAPLIEANIGQEFMEEDFRRITQEIVEMAREKGFIFATAQIPEQDVNLGILNIIVDAGKIDIVTIKGSDNKALAKLLNSITGRNITKKEVERIIILAGDIPQIRVRKTSFKTENGQNILEVIVTERKNKFTISGDNYGTENFGPTRVMLAVNYNALFSDSDQAYIAVRTNPVDLEEFAFANASYSIGINKQGTRLGVAASIGKNDRSSATFGDVSGDSRYFEVFTSHPISRSDDASLWINANAAYLEVTQDDASGIIGTDTQVTFTAGLSSNVRLFGGRLRQGTNITQGLGILGTTRLGNNLSSRFDGDGVFTKGSFYTNWRGSLAGDFGLFLSANGQIANRALLASQEFTIGGAFSVRGYNFAELSGENGVAGLVELNYTKNKITPWLDRLQPYVFFDGGYVNNIDNDFGDGSLFSTGLGLRARLGRFNFEAEGALPLSDTPFGNEDNNPQLNLRFGLDI